MINDLSDSNISNIGLNFSRSKYKLKSDNEFIPHIRTSGHAVIPYNVLKRYDIKSMKDPIALVQISNNRDSFLRIKKLSKFSNSLGISLKAEKYIDNFTIKIIKIKNMGSLDLSRQKIYGNKIPTLSVLPNFITKCSLPCINHRTTSQIYTFKNQSKVIAGIYSSNKDISFTKHIRLNELSCGSIGLYFAEGGKTQASFTNSHPKIISTFLDFIEDFSDINRGEVSTTINCSPEFASKKNKLEKFWSHQTGVKKFSNKLHLSKYVKSPCGILELQINSKLIKELICNMFNLVFKMRGCDKINIARGLLCGDGSPIQPTKYSISHHIATDKIHIDYQERFIKEIYGDIVSTIKIINKGKLVLYNDWDANLNFLYLDMYKFHIFNRKKFADQFLNLPSTKIFLQLNNFEVIDGIEPKRRYLSMFEKKGDIILNQIRPKPRKRYEILITEIGIQKQDKLKKFIKHIYPTYLDEIKSFKKTLENFELI